TPSPGEGEAAVAVAAQVSALLPNTTYHFRISATSAGGTSVGDDETFQTGESLPERGRCLTASGKNGGYANSTCTTASEGGKGAYEWLPGAGASRFTVQGGALTLETLHKAKITCTNVAGSGEYTGPKTELLQLTLTGCEEANHGECHDEKQTAGEIVLSPLEGELGTITAATTAKKPKPPSIGSSLHAGDGQAYIASFVCGTAANAIVLEGAAIAVTTPLDKMTPTFTLALAAKKSKQKPEAFEGGATSTLLASLAGGAPERAGLNLTLAATGEEPLEIKAVG
ncbi:MAG TPA: hypothetical protein VN817_02720, partial [Solirubrobacteraceae bacterium]|nr:hypothetical protein [Solirubrobacteraceae bacterium]